MKSRVNVFLGLLAVLLGLEGGLIRGIAVQRLRGNVCVCR